MLLSGIQSYPPRWLDPPEIPEVSLKDMRNKMKNMGESDSPPDDDEDEYALVQAALDQKDVAQLKRYVMQNINAACAHVMRAIPRDGRTRVIDDVPREQMDDAADALREMSLWIHTHAHAYSLVFSHATESIVSVADALCRISAGIDSRAWDGETVYHALSDIREELF